MHRLVTTNVQLKRSKLLDFPKKKGPKSCSKAILKAISFSVLHLIRDEELIYGFVCSIKRKVKTFMMMDLRRVYSALVTFHNYHLLDNFEYDVRRVKP